MLIEPQTTDPMPLTGSQYQLIVQNVNKMSLLSLKCNNEQP
jgi:hypothetical protein